MSKKKESQEEVQETPQTVITEPYVEDGELKVKETIV
jgi:hypothetical protein